MKDHTYLPEEELVQRGIEALMEALGPVETARFLVLSRHSPADSVLRHRRWQAALDKEAFFSEIFGSPQKTVTSEERS